MRKLIILAIAAALLAVPLTVLAQEEPYSTSTTTTVPPGAGIRVSANGLEVQFTAFGLPGLCCTWDFGDGQSGGGGHRSMAASFFFTNPITHTYAADGTYTVTATSESGASTSRTITVAAGLVWTGFGLVPFGLAIGALVLLGGSALLVARRVRRAER
ncbi:MAG: hypothetical protein FJW79_06140 [Actinobacteria bacterium]|nr:hypothetical protein [Actinomycetota bacterium]